MRQETVLICGDAFEMEGKLLSLLQSLPYSMLPASSFENAVTCLKGSHPIHLIILVPPLQDRNFIPRFEKFRKRPEVFGIPFLAFLRGETLKLADGLLSAFDDFILDKAPPAELLARMERLLQLKALRCEGGNWEIKLGPLRISPGNYQAHRNGRELKLTPIEFKLIQFLYQNRMRVLKREELLREVWGYKDLTQTRTIDTYIKRLRAKLGKEGKIIETWRGVGYRLKTQ